MPKCLPPLEPSGFSILDRDLTHLVFMHLGVPFLCLLKCVSHSVANACRRTLCNSDTYEIADVENVNYEHMSDCICSSSFTLPVTVNAMAWDVVNNIDDIINESNIRLIVHEFNLEFYLRNEPVTNPSQVITWFYKAWENMHDDWDDYVGPATSHELDMEVRCTKLTVEQPGVGIFHSVKSLWHHLGFETQLKEGHTNPFSSARWTISPSRKHTPLELFMRLWPYTEIDGVPFAFDDGCVPGPCKTDLTVEGSLLFCFLRERIVGTPFHKV